MTDPLDVVLQVALSEALPYGLSVQPRPPVRPYDAEAFDAARETFHRVYRRVYAARVGVCDEQAHDEAVDDALESFLGTYMELT